MNIIFQLIIIVIFVSVFVSVYRFLVNRFEHKSYKQGVWLLLFGCLLLFWINGAVGIIGSENNDANIMYICVPGLGFIVASLGGYGPEPMKRALLTMAGVQFLIAIIALLFSLGTDGNSWPKDVIGATVFFVFLWLLSASRFHAALADQGTQA
jgi:hypothetical protein